MFDGGECDLSLLVRFLDFTVEYPLADGHYRTQTLGEYVKSLDAVERSIGSIEPAAVTTKGSSLLGQ